MWLIDFSFLWHYVCFFAGFDVIVGTIMFRLQILDSICRNAIFRLFTLRHTWISTAKLELYIITNCLTCCQYLRDVIIYEISIDDFTVYNEIIANQQNFFIIGSLWFDIFTTCIQFPVLLAFIFIYPRDTIEFEL